MYDILKIRLLDEVLSRTIPQNVDYKPHNREYRVELLAIMPIIHDCTQYREFEVSGNLQENNVTITLIAEGKTLVPLLDLPYIAHEGDRTPIYKIIRSSVLFAYGALQLPYLYQNLKKIPLTEYPFGNKAEDDYVKKEIHFMQKLSTVSKDKERHTKSRATLIHPTSSRIKEIISFYNQEDAKETAIREKIKESIDALKTYAPTKADEENAVPDVFIWDHMVDDPTGTLDTRVILLNTNPKDKERFWWDYLKLNLYLSDVEYCFGYCLLMNRWKITVIQKWLAEYREKGYFESQRAKDYMAFYLKTGEKTPVRILNSDGKVIKMRLARRLPF